MAKDGKRPQPDLMPLLRSISHIRADLGEVEGKLREFAAPSNARGADISVDVLELARRLYAERRMRGRFFPEALFADPAWDMLLDLYIARHERRVISTTSACIGAAVPATTALRWITRLEKAGLVTRRPGSPDERLVVVELTEAAAETMTDLLIRMAVELESHPAVLNCGRDVTPSG